jgi:hypothetical protein
MNKLLFSILLFSLLSCSEEKINIPPGVFSQQEMTKILSDIHLAQSSLNIKSQTDTTTYSISDYTALILKQHKVSKTDFLASLKFYSENPELLKQVYDSIITNLTKMEGELEVK